MVYAVLTIAKISEEYQVLAPKKHRRKVTDIRFESNNFIIYHHAVSVREAAE